MTKGLTGIPSLAYVGVNAGSPPNIKMYKRSPTVDDSKNFIIGDLWLNITPTPAASRELWMLVALLGNYATWVQILPQTGGGGNGWLRSDDFLIEKPDPAFGAVNVFGGEPYGGNPQYINIYTKWADQYTLNVCLERSIFQPNTNAAGDEGLYSLGEHDFLHNFGTDNTACGGDALNRNLDTITAVSNTAIGHEALHAIQSGPQNSALGSGALADLIGGGYNIGIGYDAGTNFNLNESSNIIIGLGLGVTGDNNTIRIGNMPVPPYDPFGVPTVPGNGEQDKCYIAGIWNGVATIPALDTGLVLVDEEGKLYVDNIAPDSVVMTDAGGNPIAVKGPKGTVLTGRGLGGADPAPAFLELKSAGGTVGITVIPVGPDIDCINLEVLPAAGGIATLTADTGIVLPLLANINVIGGDLINTDNLVANTITVNLDKSTLAPAVHCEIVTGMGPAAASIYKELFSSDGSILFDLGTDPTKIDITAPGGGGGALTNLKDMNDIACIPVAGVIKIDAGDNIETATTGPGILEVRVTDDVDLPSGHMYCRDDCKTTNGNLVASLGHLLLPNTDTLGGWGTIKFGGVRWISNWGMDNIFVGSNSGNLTLLVPNAFNNVCIGSLSGSHLTTGQRNVAMGYSAMRDNTTGNQNTCIGEGTMIQSTVSNYNLCLGYHAGFSLLAGAVNNSNIYIEHLGYNPESNAIRIGQDGVSAHHADKCYIAGIYNATDGTDLLMVTIGKEVHGSVTDYKLSAQAIPSAGASTYTTDSGNAAPVGGIIKIKGGYNIGTRGATNIVTVDVDGSIQQNNTTAAGDGIYALGTRGANTYTTNRFMHNYGLDSTYLGRQAGPISDVGGTRCVGIGKNALDACQGGYNVVAIGVNSMTVATTSNNTTCLGNYSGNALTTGSSNLLLGSSSGTAYTTESGNIILGGYFSGVSDASKVGDASVMRLGYESTWGTIQPDPHFPPTFGRVKTGTLKTYIYGIFNETIAASATPVYVDQYGQLGTSGAVAFSFHQNVALPNITGDGTYYRIGSAAIANGGLVLDFDSTSSVSLGGMNAEAVFTAPYSGKYILTAEATYNIPGLPVPPPPAPSSSTCTFILTSNRSYSFSAYIPDPEIGIAQQVSEITTTFVYLDSGDTVTWAVRISGGTKTIGLNVSQAGPTGQVAWDTFFTGYRMS